MVPVRALRQIGLNLLCGQLAERMRLVPERVVEPFRSRYLRNVVLEAVQHGRCGRPKLHGFRSSQQAPSLGEEQAELAFTINDPVFPTVGPPASEFEP